MNALEKERQERESGEGMKGGVRGRCVCACVLGGKRERERLALGIFKHVSV